MGKEIIPVMPFENIGNAKTGHLKYNKNNEQFIKSAKDKSLRMAIKIDINCKMRHTNSDKLIIRSYTMMLTGISASQGIAWGRAFRIEKVPLPVVQRKIDDVDREIQRLHQAIEETKKDLKRIRDKTLKKFDQQHAAIFEAHLLVASDPELIERVTEAISQDRVNAEYALKTIRDEFLTLFESMDNEYMRERAQDIKDVTDRILSKLLDIQQADLSLIQEDVILVAHDLTPSETALMDTGYVRGIVTDVGGRTSHAAIMARSLELPAIVGTKKATATIQDGDLLIVDATQGVVHINPSVETLARYREKQAQYQYSKQILFKLKEAPTVTKDGTRVELFANIGSPQDLKGVLSNGAEGIGLFRTEFLYMRRPSLPTEEEQVVAYRQVLEAMAGKPVLIRTLDIGGDKELPYLHLPRELNPFLGYRAIRLCLDRPGVFKTQLRALLRASVYGNLRIMFPMIATVEEFLQAKTLLLKTKKELKQEGIETSDTIPVGMMVEVPSAAILADQFAEVVDFFSIGTNDLIQYTFAADRMNERVAYLYQPYHPSILRLIKHVIDAAHRHGKAVGMCGEMAGDPIAVPLLLGLGLDEFSMSAISILPTRQLIRNLSKEAMVDLAKQALNLTTMDEVIKLVRDKLQIG
uniref:Phosphoenolpyruvate-protein phosphotransferase n=1 Tax=uncultured firmicutes bacterium contig_61 TaxID=1643555 RepID=A0A141GNG7_9FIRM|nr:PTS-EI.PTSI, phosphotransferase system, enzyme I, PtsI [uncultured firmicutes bacterium contig_61]